MVLLVVCFGAVMAGSFPAPAAALELSASTPVSGAATAPVDGGAVVAPAVTAPVKNAAAVYTLPPEKLVKARRLDAARTWIYFGSEIWGIAFLVLVLALRWASGLRDWAARRTSTSGEAGKRTARPWLQGLLFLPALLVILSVADLPFSVVGHHLSLVYGQSIQGWSSWFWDWTKSLLLTLLGGTLVLSLVGLLVRRSERWWWFWFWLMALPMQVLLIFAVPYVIDPLFEHFEPLAKSNPALVDQLERVVARGDLRIPASRMFLMRASDKVTTLNAYVTGIGASKRVVVWDTTVEKCPADEILFIFGHEQGHYVLGHILDGLIAATVGGFFLLWLEYLAVRWLVARRGVRWDVREVDDWAAMAVLLLVFSVLSFLGEPVSNAFSRVIEHHADIYGQEVIHGLVADPQRSAVDAFQRLGESSLDVPDPNHFVEFWTYSHPSISRRVAFAAHYDPWRDGERPRYFAARQQGR